jgi:hypothetical protein
MLWAVSWFSGAGSWGRLGRYINNCNFRRRFFVSLAFIKYQPQLLLLTVSEGILKEPELQKKCWKTRHWKIVYHWYTIISLYHFFEDSDIFISFFNGWYNCDIISKIWPSWLFISFLYHFSFLAQFQISAPKIWKLSALDGSFWCQFVSIIGINNYKW